MNTTPDPAHRLPPGPGHHHDHGHGPEPGRDADHGNMTELLDLDADVLDGYWTSALDWVGEAAAVAAPARLVDLGAGTGTGAIGLARRFPGAEVIAVDVEPGSLQLLQERAAALGLAPRLRTVTADLDAGWPDLGLVGLTWASMSLHHLADPPATLGEVLAATTVGGLIAVAEFPEPLRFLPDDLGLGEPGFEDRALAVLGRAHAEQMPTLGTAWAPRLAGVGWQVIAERDFRIDLNRPAHPQAGRYARAWFSRLAHGLSDRLAPADAATLAALLDEAGPNSLLHRKDLHIRGTRTVILARRG